MADKDNGFAQLLLDVFHLVLQRLAGHGVQSAERLIHQHNRRGGRQSPQHADPLLLAAGELGRILLGVGFHIDHFQKVPDDLITFGLVILEQLGHDADVLSDRHVGEQTDLLDHIADVAAQIYLVLIPNIFAVNEDGAAVGFQQAVDHFHGGGFAAAGRADEHHELTVFDGEVQVFEYGCFPIALADVFKLDHRASFVVTRW